MNEPELNLQLCAHVSRMQQEDPIASAPAHKRYVLAEVPEPWPKAALQSERFPAGLPQVVKEHAREGRAASLLAFHCEHKRSPEGYMRLFYMRHPGYPCSRFEQSSYVVPLGQVCELADALLHSETGDTRIEAFDGWREPEDERRRELFVCVHGSHDECCGLLGYPAYRYVREHYRERGDIRVWCASHFGGHRHAPTLIEFPQGRYWAQMRREQLDMLVLRNRPAAELYRHYRGWGMIGRMEQVAERELLAATGWEWDEYVKQAGSGEREDGGTGVRIDYARDASQPFRRYEAAVWSDAVVATGGCGHDPGEARQYRIAERPEGAGRGPALSQTGQ